MTQITIAAQVVNGHLQHEQSLAELEGQRVTLTVVPSGPASGNGATQPTPQAVEKAEFDPEPPPWLDVEHDVYFPIKVPRQLLEKKPVIVRRGKPCIILPEELPDD
jgi:hypothetical protein